MEQTYGNYPQSQGLGHFGSYAGGSQPYYDDDMDMMHYGSMGQMGQMGASGGLAGQYPMAGQMYPGQHPATSMYPGMYGMPGYGQHMGMPMGPGYTGAGYGHGQMPGYPGYAGTGMGMGMGPGMMHGYYPGMTGRDCHC
ncbi:hypothetical protein [Heyndrickxia coagulans]|uniref:hypothetical protein n=1 Tax=Heyndrickxia coagulans TaxID=1398 RepID=UPI00041D3F53|nr:hypothetical protein [Heyndrickxia coagulans]